MAQWFTECTALTEDSHSVSRTHVWQLTIIGSRKSNIFFGPAWPPASTYIHTYTQTRTFVH